MFSTAAFTSLSPPSINERQAHMFRICRCLASQTTSYSWVLRKTPFYKADAELPSASAAFQPEPRTTAASSSHEQGGGSTELVASGEPNSSQFWDETVGPRGEQRVHDVFYVSLVRLARKHVDVLITELGTLSQVAMLQGDWVAVGACGLDGTRQLTEQLTRRTGRQ